MNAVTLSALSDCYTIRRLSAADLDMLYAFCKANAQYYAYCGREVTPADILSDLTITPPGTSLDQKYYIGFFSGDTLTAIMDLIAGYPDSTYAFIGFFMMNRDKQGHGAGSNLIQTALNALKAQGFKRCKLAIHKENPQATHFWQKNGFQITREIPQEDGTLLVAEKAL